MSIYYFFIVAKLVADEETSMKCDDASPKLVTCEQTSMKVNDDDDDDSYNFDELLP